MNIAIIGATGVVGRQMIECLNEENIDVNELKLFASKKSKGTIINFKGKDIIVEELKEDSFKNIDVVLGASSNEIAKEYAPIIKKEGAVFIDNSSYFRLFDDVPLVVPEINSEDIKKHKGIIANPNCSTIISLMAINAINNLSPTEKIVASTYQAVSGAGKEGIEELENEIDGDCCQKVFPYQIAYNLIPAIGETSEDDYTKEEMKLQNEGRKILHLPSLKATCTCVRVPIKRCHSISLSIKCKDKLDLSEVKEALKKQEGIVYYDDLDNLKYPMPLLANDQNKVYVGRVRRDLVFDGGVALFCVGDQIRKGAAYNAVQIIKYL